MSFPNLRLRRLRGKPAMRDMVREVHIESSDLIYPIFVQEDAERPSPVQAMPGILRQPIKGALKEAELASSLGIPAVILFGIPSKKDEEGSSAYDKNGVIQQTLRAIRRQPGGEIVAITDVCVCEYTTHGHCGIIKGKELLNDPTLKQLQRIAVSHAEAGADMVAPSGMIDGQVKAIREALDDSGFTDVAIMSYSAKHASSFYGPFREAVDSKPRFGDRRGYQMDYSNPGEAMREIELDVQEGADIIMVKPALAYLDIIHSAKRRFGLPVAAYSVSGEYSMIKAASERGWIEEEATVLEVLTAIKRAGADMILTYFAKDVASWLKRG